VSAWLIVATLILARAFDFKPERFARHTMPDQYSIILWSQEVFAMTDAAESAWAEGILGGIWDQLLTMCHPQAIGHIKLQLTCKE